MLAENDIVTNNMKITKTQLKKLIEENVKRALNEQLYGSENVVNAYLEALAWASTGEDENGETTELDKYDFADECWGIAEKIVSGFIQDCTNQLGVSIDEILERNNQDYGGLGHDLFLTSAGHGTGFWDGDWKVDGQVLTKLSKKYAVDPWLAVYDDPDQTPEIKFDLPWGMRSGRSLPENRKPRRIKS